MSKVPKLSPQMVVDTLLFFALCGSLVALNALGEPGSTGFWCHDESISLPYKPDSITKRVLLTIAFGVPLFVIVLTECVRLASGNKKTCPLKAQFLNIVKAYGVFMFGMTADCILTEMLKYSVGRLRPHFFDICRPAFGHMNCSAYVWPQIQFCTWLFAFVCCLVVYQAVKDLLRSNIIGFHRPTFHLYPTEALTAFLLDLPTACVNVRHYDALVVVHSATGHFRRRQDYRETYGNPHFTQPYLLKVIFFVGLPEDASIQSDLSFEHAHHRDLVQSNFVDTYQNLSLKAVSVFRWLIERCPPPHLIIKMDDDVLLDVHKLFEEFTPMPPYHNDLLVHCHSYEDAPVEREGKWKLSRSQYAMEAFPDYCSGSMVLLQLAAVEELYYAALDTAILWVDDVYLYGVVRVKTLDVQIMYLDQVSDAEDIYTECVRNYGYSYVEKYECTNKVEIKLLKDSRLSFPSGHASVSVYSALFTVFYLQLRLDLSFSYLLRPLAQLALVLLATFCCVTRISDHKHFVSDIVAGAAIGSCFAWLTFYKLGMRVIQEVQTASKPRILPRAMSVESEPQTPTPLLRPAAYIQARRPDFADKV